MARKKTSEEGKLQKIKNESRSAKRSGKITTNEGKVNKSTAKTNTPRSQKKDDTIKKYRH